MASLFTGTLIFAWIILSIWNTNSTHTHTHTRTLAQIKEYTHNLLMRTVNTKTISTMIAKMWTKERVRECRGKSDGETFYYSILMKMK